MKARLQAGRNGRVPALPEKRFLVSMAMLSADGSELKTSTLNVPRYAMSATPVYLAGRLYFRMQDHVTRYDLSAPR